MKMFEIITKLKKRIFLPFNYKKFWNKRYKKYGLEMLYCGNKGADKETNIQIRKRNIELFDSVLKKLNITKDSRILDIGCGVGAYAEYFKEQGYRNYTGIELLPEVVRKLNLKFPDYYFIQKDIFKNKIDGTYDLIIMMSVTQHIIKDEQFNFVIGSIPNLINLNGYFITTDTLEDKRDSNYTRRRTIEHYLQQLGHLKFTITPYNKDSLKIICFEK